MSNSLRLRLWLTYALIVGVVIFTALFAVVVYLLRNPGDARLELQRLHLVSRLVLQRGQALELRPDGQLAPRLQERLMLASETLDARLVVFGPGGQVLVDSYRLQGPPLPDWAFFNRRLRGLLPVYQDDTGKNWLYVLTPLEAGYSLLVTAPRPRTPVLGILRDEFLAPMIRAALIALLLALLLAVWVARWVAGPLQRMAQAVQTVAAPPPSGEFKHLPLEGPSEVQVVARAFNEMVDRVQASQRSQRDFIANVSHDLKTPLTSIQGFAQAILDGTADDPQARQQAAGVIYDEAGRMNRMVLDLLELARLDTGMVSFQRQPFDLAALLKGLVEKFTPQARQKGIDLSMADGFEASVGPQVVIGDEDRLAQVFSNLLDNALKYTPAGGQVLWAAQVSAGWVEVQVADSGPGIPVEELERIFERFYQTDKARRGGGGRGVGLGLAIAREIVQLHGGAISAYNRKDRGPGQGSVFVVKLPLALPDDTTVIRRRKPEAER